MCFQCLIEILSRLTGNKLEAGYLRAQRWALWITPIYRLGNIGNIPEIVVKNIQQTFEFSLLNCTENWLKK